MKLLTHWILSVLAIVIAAYLLPGVTTTVVGAVVLAVVIGIINLFIRPLLFILTLPVTIITLGIFSLVLNALLVWLAILIVPGVSVTGFWSVLVFSILISIINAFFHLIEKKS